MVRTYSFNPSTQCFTDDMPCLKSKNTFYGSYNPSSNFEKTRYASENKLFTNYPPPIERQNYNFNSRKNSLENNNNSIFALKPQMSASTSLSSCSSGARTVLLMDDSTSIVGIRSVLINGQKFYQPIDISQQNIDRKIPISLFNEFLQQQQNNNNFIKNSQQHLMLENNNEIKSIQNFNPNNAQQQFLEVKKFYFLRIKFLD